MEILNLLDIGVLWSVNGLDIHNLKAQISCIFGAYEAGLWSPGYFGLTKGKSHGYLQISRTFINLLNRAYKAYEVWMLWILKNLMDILGPKGSQSHGYLWISWLFQTYEGQISLIFGAYEARSPWYLGPMKGESHGYLKISGHSWISWLFGAYEAWISWILGAYEAQLSRIFAKLKDIQGLWGAGCSGPV